MIARVQKQLTFAYSEKRQSPRLPCFLSIDVSLKEKYGFSHVEEISLRGVGVVCVAVPTVKVGDRLFFKFYLPGHGEQLSRKAKVVSVSGKRIGLHFDAFNELSEKAFLDHYESVYNQTEELESQEITVKRVVSSAAVTEPARVEPASPLEKRTSFRKRLKQYFQIELVLKSGGKLNGRVIEEGEKGLLFEFHHKPGIPLSVRVGDRFSDSLISGPNKKVRTGPVRVCHVTPLPDRGLIRVGLKIGK